MTKISVVLKICKFVNFLTSLVQEHPSFKTSCLLWKQKLDLETFAFLEFVRCVSGFWDQLAQHLLVEPPPSFWLPRYFLWGRGYPPQPPFKSQPGSSTTSSQPSLSLDESQSARKSMSYGMMNQCKTTRLLRCIKLLEKGALTSSQQFVANL